MWINIYARKTWTPKIKFFERNVLRIFDQNLGNLFKESDFERKWAWPALNYEFCHLKNNILEEIGRDELVPKYNCDANCHWLPGTAFDRTWWWFRSVSSIETENSETIIFSNLSRTTSVSILNPTTSMSKKLSICSFPFEKKYFFYKLHTFSPIQPLKKIILSTISYRLYHIAYIGLKSELVDCDKQ